LEGHRRITRWLSSIATDAVSVCGSIEPARPSGGYSCALQRNTLSAGFTTLLTAFLT
jgi:hypothetical protein